MSLMEQARLLCEDQETIIIAERLKTANNHEFVVFRQEKDRSYLAIYNLSCSFKYDIESLNEVFGKFDNYYFFSDYNEDFGTPSVTNHYITYENNQRFYHQKTIDETIFNLFFRIPLRAILNSVCKFRTAKSYL